MALNYRKRILASFLVATIVMLTVALSVFGSFREMERQKEWVDHTDQVINKVNDVFNGLKDAQSSQRGYLITGYEDYLAPYYIAMPKLQDNMHLLTDLVADNPKQLERANNLALHVKERITVLEKVLDIYKAEGQAKAFDEIKKGTGKREMDEARSIVTDMTGEEQKLLTQRQQALTLSSEITTAAGLAGLVICFLILVAVFFLIDREADQRVKTEESLKEAVDEMEKITSETQLIGRIGDYLRGCRDEGEAYSIIEKNMPLLFPYTYGNVSIFNNSRNMLQSVLKWGEIPAVDKEFEAEDCWALRQGRIHQSLNDGAVPMCEHLKVITTESSNLCLPMQAQGETIGQIYVGSGNSHALQEHQVLLLRTVGEQISLALANLNLQRALREQSIKDPLTKLFNRRYLEETLVREVSRAQRNLQPMAVMIMDIDFFKKVNDTYGHDGGDAVLMAFAKMLGTKMRKEDVACRLGGEEFVLVLPSATVDLGRARAEEICDATRKMKVKFQNQTIAVTVSIGLAMFPEHGVASEELIQNADLALYSAKRTGRDRVITYAPQEDEESTAAE